MIEHGANITAIDIGGLEVVTGASYMMILLGFGLRRALEGPGVRLLWPWALMLIFGLCGLTRMIVFTQTPIADFLCIAFHVTLMIISMVYGIGQMLYAFWPEIFEQDTVNPKFVD